VAERTEPVWTAEIRKFMRWSDVIDVIDTTRRHVGGILNIGLNKTELNADIWPWFCQGNTQTMHFEWHIIRRTSIHKFTTLYCCDMNTSNMAAIIIADRMTSLSPMCIDVASNQWRTSWMKNDAVRTVVRTKFCTPLHRKVSTQLRSWQTCTKLVFWTI